MKTLEDLINASKSISDIHNIPNDCKKHLIKIADNCYKQKGVYTVTVTLLLYKINYPSQDIRLHQSGMRNGFSGRSFDTTFVTPELARLGLPAMAESGWLTRSLEQPYPYNLNYNGKISGGIKEDFLLTLDYVQKNPKHANSMLRILLNEVLTIVKANEIKITPLKHPENLTIDNTIKALDKHFKYNYGTHNGSKLPVLAFYAIYKTIIKEIKRYETCTLAPLSKLTACDLTSKASGDIEIFKNKKLFEAVEIKLDKEISPAILRVVEKKIYSFNPQRYYILSYYGIKDDEKEEINKIVESIKLKHGCQIIVNGLLPTIKYYLRLISSVETFIKDYSKLVQMDNELQKIHKEVWNSLIKEINKK